MARVIARCLFKATEVKQHEYGDGKSEEVTMRAEYDADNPRDRSFSQYTPSGELTFFVNNQNVVGKIEEGRQYHITITPADEADQDTAG